MDWIAPTDEELVLMTEEETLDRGIDLDDPFAPRKREYLGDHYPVCLVRVSTAASLEMGKMPERRPMRECWIDLEARLNHVPGCRCIHRLT